MAKTKKYDQEADKNLMYALIILVLVMVLFWTLRTGARNYGTPPAQQSNQMMMNNEYPSIEDSSDLDKASGVMDNTDLNTIDKELNSLDSDASSF